MRTEWRDTTTDNVVKNTPGVSSVQNEEDLTKVEITPEMISVEEGEDDIAQLTPRTLIFTNAEGHTLAFSIESGVVITKDADSLEVSIENGFLLTKGGHTTQLEDLHLLFDDGAGLTNSITEEQMVISGDDKMAVYESSSLHLSDGDATVTIDTFAGIYMEMEGGIFSAKPSELHMDLGGDEEIDLSPEAGLLIQGADGETILDVEHLSIVAGDDTAEFSAAGGVHLAGSGGGIVDIATIDGEEIMLRETQACKDDDGTPTAVNMMVLRGEETE